MSKTSQKDEERESFMNSIFSGEEGGTTTAVLILLILLILAVAGYFVYNKYYLDGSMSALTDTPTGSSTSSAVV